MIDGFYLEKKYMPSLQNNNEIPWELIKLLHIQKYGYSGTVLRALRIKHNVAKETVARCLRRRIAYLTKLENTDKIGIKVAKDLAQFFNLKDWRILRTKPSEIKFS